MSLVTEGRITEDPFVRIADDAPIPGDGAILVSLSGWQANRSALEGRTDPVGVLLRSDEHPEAIADAVDQLQLIALEFPTFRDGRAYSYARLLRERYGFDGELRAVGDVELEQLHYMHRVGFNAFEIDSDDPVRDLEIAGSDFSTWYQPSGDQRRSAAQLRAPVRPAGGPSRDPGA